MLDELEEAAAAVATLQMARAEEEAEGGRRGGSSGEEGEEEGEEEGGEEGEVGGAEGGGGDGGAQAMECAEAEEEEGAGAAAKAEVVLIDHLGTMAAEAEATAAALAAAPPPVAGLARGVASHHLLDDGAVQAIIAPLAATESSYVVLQAAGIAPTHAHYPALRVVIEHLTALEGDFWVKLRGAGLTYGSRLSNDAESRVLSFSLYRCADALAAYLAAQQIVKDYASGVLSISEVQLAGAKSSLAYAIISRTSTKSSAFSAAWSSAYLELGADHGQRMLAQVDGVGVAEAMHALRTYLVPLFVTCPKTSLFVTCPVAKAEAIAAGFAEVRGAACTIVPEEQLNATFSADKAAPPPQTKGGAKSVSALGSAPFSFAKRPGAGNCECPKCLPSAPEAT